MSATKQILSGSAIYFDKYDISTWIEEFAMVQSRKEIIDTSIDKSGVERMAGISDVSFTCSGIGDLTANGIRGIEYGALDGAKIVTVCEKGAAVGDVAHFVQLTNSKFARGGKVGEKLPFAGAGLGNNSVLVKGTIFATGAKTSTAGGAAQNIGALATGQSVYGCVQCTANTAGGDHKITVKIQSCATSGFASGVTDRITFSDITPSVLSTWGSALAGPVTDAYWRAYWTIAGSASPSFTLVVSCGFK